MKKLYLIVVVFTFALIPGCMFPGSTSEITGVIYPAMITESDPFDLEGEYLTTKPKDLQVNIFLTVREVGSDKGLYSDELVINQQSQKFSFPAISLNTVRNPVYFELKVIIDGKVSIKWDSKNDATEVANWHTNIGTTYFNPVGTTTWGVPLQDENPFYFALPYRDFYYYVWDPEQGEKVLTKKDYFGVTDVKNRWIEIYYPANNRFVYAQWVDVGPWNIYDPYYVFGTSDERPYAEIGLDMGWSSKGYRETNLAGLDISPTAMSYLADSLSYGIIRVNWRFIPFEQVPPGPWSDKISVTKADDTILNLETATLRTLDIEESDTNPVKLYWK